MDKIKITKRSKKMKKPSLMGAIASIFIVSWIVKVAIPTGTIWLVLVLAPGVAAGSEVTTNQKDCETVMQYPRHIQRIEIKSTYPGDKKIVTTSITEGTNGCIVNGYVVDRHNNKRPFVYRFSW